MKLALYQIENEYKAIAEQLFENGGEATPEIKNALLINKDNLTTKVTNYGMVVKERESAIEMRSALMQQLKHDNLIDEKIISRLKGNLSNAMELYGVEEIKSPIMKINFRKSESVEVENIDLLDKDFVITKETKQADKASIKDAIKKGTQVIGAILKTNKNLQIK